MATERWVLVEPGALDGRDRLILDVVESRHLAVTLRLGRGELVSVCDGRGGLAVARLAAVDSRRCELEVVEPLPHRGPPEPAVTIALAVLHSQAMDWAVQKCVEVGVTAFVPVLTGRSQLAAKAARGRLGHWRKVARQALKQCRRCWEMEVSDPIPLDRLLDLRRDRPGLLADPGGTRIEVVTGDLPDLLLVGPEGGLSEHELALADSAGWQPVSLGAWVLRADTAAVVGAARLIAARDRG